jgi:hypothetical protein
MNIAALIFTFFTVFVCLFQLSLALGAPWGKLAMGGKYPGRFPVSMRITALIQFFILGFLTVIVLTRAGIIYQEWFLISKKLVWVTVAISVVSLFANLATPSKWERILWAPVAVVLLISSIFVAVG